MHAHVRGAGRALSGSLEGLRCGGRARNSDELIAGLERGQIGGIGLDVWENEGESGTPCITLWGVADPRPCMLWVGGWGTRLRRALGASLTVCA